VSIKDEDMVFEVQHLEETKSWIQNQIENISMDDKKLKSGIDNLRKQLKGKYNEELETKEKLYNITHQNLEKYMESFEQPYFGRINFREYKRDEESFYIGKFGLGDIRDGDEKVIDWRSPLADLYYSGTFGDAFYRAPMGIVSGKLSLKRKFLIRNSELKDAFDDGINDIMLRSSDEKGNSLTDEFLKINLEESISTKLKDVVATIQKEQNDIIRTEKNISLIVQGSAGSGKTTVALHRLAYLLYKYKDKLEGKNILVIAPNELFLDYISEVLPDLGVSDVKQSTFEQISMNILGIKNKILTKDKKLSYLVEESDIENKSLVIKSSSLKGSILYKSFLDGYIKYMEEQDSNIDDIKVDNYIMFKQDEIKRLYLKDMINFPINRRKDEIKRYFKLKIDDKIKFIMDKVDFSYAYLVSRIKSAMEDGEERRKKLREIYSERDDKKKRVCIDAKKSFEVYFDTWKGVSTESKYSDFLNSDYMFKKFVDGKVSKDAWNFIRDEFNKNAKENIIDSDDLASLLYLKFKIEGISEKFKYKHIVIDEAQDYSEFQFSVFREMAYNNSMTIVGDIGQEIYYYKGISNWESLTENVFKENFKYVGLSKSYRSTIEIMEFANRVLKLQKNNLKPAVPILRNGEKPEIFKFKTNRDFAQRLDEIVFKVKHNNKKSIAVIGRNYKQCKKIKDYLRKYSNYDWRLIKENDKNLELDCIIIPSYMTKGLEFDCSVIYNCNEENYVNNELDKKILYVALTRALHFEFIFYSGNISNLIMNDK
jgi:DNA helicase-2/ATP-dependent DNA helicase PcrA